MNMLWWNGMNIMGWNHESNKLDEKDWMESIEKNGMNHEYDKLGWNGINKMEWDE